MDQKVVMMVDGVGGEEEAVSLLVVADVPSRPENCVAGVTVTGKDVQTVVTVRTGVEGAGDGEAE